MQLKPLKTIYIYGIRLSTAPCFTPFNNENDKNRTVSLSLLNAYTYYKVIFKFMDKLSFE